MLIRTIECTQGQVQVEAVCEPMFDYAREPAAWEFSADEHGGVAHGRGKHGPNGEEQEIRLASDLYPGNDEPSVVRNEIDGGEIE